MSSFLIHLRRFSISNFEISLCRPEVRSFAPFSLPKGGGGGGGGGGAGDSRIFLSICSVTPFLDQVFRRFFRMDNLRDYGEDDAVSSSGFGRSLAKLPSSSEGHLAPTSSQVTVMEASIPATMLVTSGPVPAVSAPTTPASSVHKDSTVALDDLPPPPPPVEPYEVFLARVSQELSSLPVHSAQPGAAMPPRPAVPTSTTGSRLPTPFPRYEDSSWALQPQTPGGRIPMPLPASCYVPPPSPWVWTGRGPAVDVTMVRGPPPATLPISLPGLPGPSGLPAGPPAVGPVPVPPPSTPSTDLNPPRPWVPLLLTSTWAPTHCSSRVPLTTERHHGLSIRPVQSELAVTHVATVDLARCPLRITLGHESDASHVSWLILPDATHVPSCQTLKMGPTWDFRWQQLIRRLAGFHMPLPPLAISLPRSTSS